MSTKSEVGREGERLAENFLRRLRFGILARNWKSRRWGEIDLVAKDKDCLVFVEVKTRTANEFGQPFEAVNYYKIKSLVRAAHNYKLQNPATPDSMRIDVVSVVLRTPPKIEYFQSVYQEWGRN